jgi:serine/threonine protein kinase/Tol biopolymer transport system component
MTLAAGSKLGPYEILGQIGAGGMGEVYRAKDPRLGREVAIKVLPASFSQDADRLRRFEQEAKAAGILNHPNVTAVYDVGTNQSDGAPYVVQELLDGETLRSVLAGGKPPQRKALEYAAQIAQGLAAAHDKGIVHRDLKPENLFVTRDGRVKILDFGLAKLTQREGSPSVATNLPTETKGTEPGVVLGTLGYMSPEQVRGRPTDARSDIFSFGAILYELLSGNRAFRGDSAADTMSAILKEDPPDLSLTNQNVSPGLERIVRHCLEKNPEQRFQSARDLAFDIEVLSGTSASSLSVATAAPHRPTRLPSHAAMVLAVLALPLAGYLLGKRQIPSATSAPTYRQLTFRRGRISTARFAPDGQTIVFSAAWDGAPLEIYSTRLEFPDSKSVGFARSALLAISTQGELAMIQGGEDVTHQLVRGTVSRAALSGGAAREILESVREADWGPGGRDLAVVHYADNRDRLEFPVGKVVYETSGWVGSPRVSPAGDRIAFADHEVWPDDRGAVAVVDLAGKKRILSTGWESIEGIAWRPDGREVWFTAATAGLARDLHAVDLEGRQRLIARVPGGFVIQDLFRDGRALLTRNTEQLSIWGLPPGETQERDLSWLEWSIPGDLSPDGKDLLFSEEGIGGGANYTACLRRTDGSPVVRLGQGGPFAFSPDGKWAVTIVPSSPGQIQLLPVGPGEPRRIDRGSVSGYMSVDIFPDGKRLLFCGTEAGRSGLYIQEIAGGKPHRIGDAQFGGEHPISPDGKTLAVYDPDRRIVLMPAEGGTPKPLPGFTKGDVIVRWAADGTLFIGHGDVRIEIAKLDVATGRRTPWKTLAPVDPSGVEGLGGFQLTPDGKSYVYGCLRVLSDLYIAEGLK